MAQSFSVLTNIPSLFAQSNLFRTNFSLNKTLSQISSGQRIVDASDDPAGLAIYNMLKSDVTALDQASRNVKDAQGVLQIADGTLSNVTELINRAITLAEEASTGTLSSSERETIDIEYQSIKSEIDRVFSAANFKGTHLFSTSGAVNMSIYVGDVHVSSTITLSIGGSASASNLGLSGNLKTASTAQTELTNLKNAITSISRWRGVLGAQMNRLKSATTTISTQKTNLESAASTIMDVNMAQAMVDLTKYQVLLQSGMASLFQANTMSQAVLGLFR